MSRLFYSVSLTMVGWLIGSFAYAYYWVWSCLSDPGIASYERDGVLPLLSFVVYRLPYLSIGLLVVIVLELIFIRGLVREEPGMI